MTVKQILVVIGAAMVLGLSGCKGSRTLPLSTGGAASDGDPAGASTTGSDDGGGIGVFADDSATGGLNDLVVYFEYDRVEILSEFNSMLSAHGRYLASNPNVQIRLEGHADERGSREYNIGLGERRAQSVRQILLLQGATAGQLSTVSYGEERAAVFGSDEESYSLNRRVELVYR